ncbi:uncharacterized protein LOC110230947 [Arabidopsis lyrata subsp. lyrata]|uniref:uncharacterized protein LOC110230947 n=1 Tax=Arabidopsis lyrata subsp. lyrata TaxID=81972 RepID=UPI000A29DEAD|nr:uncharacterized protein LOC110230947 [Arabidopsis lyrata subsp. lyrata]|eukprot:XP_020890967.1 uncharacterized protein LOC110230947 [Arabidopsis lyrata subsp. lyrata]
MVEMVIEKNACLWRPSTDLRVIGDALHERIVWPVDKVDPIIAPSIRSSHVSANSNNTSSTQSGQKKKCYLIDCSKPGQKVAEGRVWSSNPTDTVHLKPLGPNASKVSVDVPLVGNAKVWKPSSEIQTIDDALGSLVAWPSDKLLFM